MPVPPVQPAHRLRGVDFTSAPSRRKSITVAHGRRVADVVRLDRLDALEDWPSFEALLTEAGPWLAVFDFPFGLPRTFVEALDLGTSAQAVSNNLQRRCAQRMDFRSLVDAWSATQAPGARLPHRKTDGAMPGTTSTSPLQTRYVPVGFMYFEGLPRLLRAGLNLPGLHAGDPQRIGLEGYPGLLAHELIGRRSYKNRDEPDRLIARKDIVEALEQGRTRLGLRLKLSNAQRESLVSDASGDRLDAALCLLQAGWASVHPDHGLPRNVDPVEGWIVTA